METVIPFRAWRYDPLKAGALSRLIAPPYDVIDPSLQSRLYSQSPYNVVRVDLGMTTPNDDDCDNQYLRAATQLSEWKKEGILTRDTEPSVTFVEEAFTGPDGRKRKRQGFLALVRLHDFSEGVVFPHERTLSGPKEDRFCLMDATGMSLSPVFLLYDLPGDEITEAWRSGAGQHEPASTVVDASEGPGKVETRLWPVSDPDLLDLISTKLADGCFVVADGHHRYETALRYQSSRREALGEAAGPVGKRPFDYALAYFTNMSDPSLAIFATHRLVKGVDPAVIAALPEALGPEFEVKKLAERSPGTAGVMAARFPIERYLAIHPRGAFAMWGPGLDGAYGFRLVDKHVLDELACTTGPACRSLDVTILESLVLQKRLGITQEDIARQTHVDFCREQSETFAHLTSGDYQVGFFMNPTGLEQIREVALGGERMPQKATFFHPKLPTGLVFHDLDSDL